MNLVELARNIREQKVTSEEIVRKVFQNIDENEYNLHAYLAFWKDEAVEKARACDERIRLFREKNGTSEADNTALPPLLGVPVAIKDNLLYAGKPATCGSKMLENYIPPFAATCVEKLEEAGAVIIGKTNMDEFGMGVSTEHSYFGATSHPMDPKRVPGGSSGGSAAAVAANEALAALGTDTGGSVRQPAAFCGLYGLRPTYGSVSRHGLVAFASSMDQAGPITRSSIDAAVLYNIVTGADEKDQTSVLSPKIDLEVMENYRMEGKRIGIPKQLLAGEGKITISEEVANGLSVFRDFLRENGAVVEEVDMPVLSYAVPVYYILSSAEASSNLSRYDGIRYGFRAEGIEDLRELYTKTRSEGFGLEVKRRILLGNYVLSSEHFEDIYRKAEKARNLIRKAFDDAFERYDLLLSPTSPVTAPEKGEISDDPLTAYTSDLCTVPASLSGIPAISIPVKSCPALRPCAAGGNDEVSGNSPVLPIGIQLMGPRFGEQEILGAARFFEKHVKGGAEDA
ncbi:MAG: Asp-tRNA(Asn)/Glu-tRNA(Gln) amidotransferase subunit GatA [Clostridiales bacterium]|nr:Asp-tRNA(Asn)/Glu-tRNA(Gln) amidotransferase subunit GatA [Clostridiales bacterium]